MNKKVVLHNNIILKNIKLLLTSIVLNVINLNININELIINSLKALIILFIIFKFKRVIVKLFNIIT